MKSLPTLALLFAALTASAQTPACTAPSTSALKPVQSGAASVKATGCVAAGVEAGCYVLVDKKSGAQTNLIFHGTPPAIGVEIEITGDPFTGISTCMASKPLAVRTCTITHPTCTVAKAPTPAK
jgi:hypothetical protein